ncbi:hypothetical protein [Myxococcus sp. CA040A]|uniref:hypothetical protein n=1 Tax=Myxococcus sp. CA040A TaxID=2741738 RepID=UPI00157A3542|nr:hypothetical protein [Myxococcus sp. CA040A]NTX08293.1 hypothetical protein [Myxococcus sp. CA040A]
MLLTPLEEKRRRRWLRAQGAALGLAGGALWCVSVNFWLTGEVGRALVLDVAGLLLVVAGDRAAVRAEGR